MMPPADGRNDGHARRRNARRPDAAMMPPADGRNDDRLAALDRRRRGRAAMMPPADGRNDGLNQSWESDTSRRNDAARGRAERLRLRTPSHSPPRCRNDAARGRAERHRVVVVGRDGQAAAMMPPADGRNDALALGHHDGVCCGRNDAARGRAERRRCTEQGCAHHVGRNDAARGRAERRDAPASHGTGLRAAMMPPADGRNDHEALHVPVRLGIAAMMPPADGRNDVTLRHHTGQAYVPQ